MNRQEMQTLIDRQRAVREAEEFLADFVQTWAVIEPELQPAAVRQAVWSLTICELHDPLQSEIRLGAVAGAAGLPKPELRRQVRERAEFFRRFNELHDRQPKAAEGALCELILA